VEIVFWRFANSKTASIPKQKVALPNTIAKFGHATRSIFRSESIFAAFHHGEQIHTLNLFMRSFCFLDMPVCSAPASQVQLFKALLVALLLFVLLQ
jgi:hypothetical protein